VDPLATLPIVLFVVLFELAVGGAVLMFVLERTEETPLGFIRLAAVVNGAAAAFGALVAPSLPANAELAARVAYVAAVLLGLYLILSFTQWTRARGLVGQLAVLTGLVLLLAASTVRDGNAWDALALLALPLGGLSLGGANAAMLLGHWYLVTPKLSPKPLQTAALIFLAALILQAALLLLAIGRGDAGLAWNVNAAATVLRVAVGILAPLPIALAAWWTARMNTQSSTGLLYIALGMVLAGELTARMLFYVTGAPL
jgi:hypothetical protein